VFNEAYIIEQHDPESKPEPARLKWFNATKGFGFAIPENDPCDAFVHITTLQDADIQQLGENARISCHIVKGPKGALVTKVEKLLDEGENPAPITFRVQNIEDEILETMEGTVKWYKPDKGFGFVIPEDGQKDVFIHQSCLERHGIDLLIPGQKMMMTVRTVAKGREILEFNLQGSAIQPMSQPSVSEEDIDKKQA